MTKIGLVKLSVLFFSLVTLLNLVGCENCNRKTKSTNRVNSCSTYNKQETLCNSAVLHDNTRCHLDPSTQLCSPLIPVQEVNCEPKGKEECDAAKECTWNSLTLGCDDARK